MEKKYLDADQKFVGKVVVYGHTDNYLYADADHTDGNTVGAKDILDLCMKGLLLVSDGTNYFSPVSFTGTTEISVVVATTGTGVELKTYKSKEPTPAEGE